MAYQFRNIEKTIGAFIVVAFLFFIGAIIFIAKGQKLWSKKNHYTTTFYSAADISQGMPVKFKGLRIGAVKKLYLDKNNRIVVEFYVLMENANIVRTNSVIKITSVSLIGEKILEITEGTTNASLATNNSFIYSFHTEKGVEMLALQTTEKKGTSMDVILKNVELLTAQLSNPRGSLQTTLRNLEKFTSAFAGMSGENKDAIASMIRDLQAITKNFKQMSESMKNHPLISGWGTSSKKKRR